MNKEKIPTQVFRFAVTNYYEVEHYNATNAFKILKDNIEHPWAFVGGEGLNTTDEIDLGRINLSEQERLMKRYTTRRDFEDGIGLGWGGVRRPSGRPDFTFAAKTLVLRPVHELVAFGCPGHVGDF